jgi:hypothetical protein
MEVTVKREEIDDRYDVPMDPVLPRSGPRADLDCVGCVHWQVPGVDICSIGDPDADDLHTSSSPHHLQRGGTPEARQRHTRPPGRKEVPAKGIVGRLKVDPLENL